MKILTVPRTLFPLFGSVDKIRSAGFLPPLLSAEQIYETAESDPSFRQIIVNFTAQRTPAYDRKRKVAVEVYKEPATGNALITARVVGVSGSELRGAVFKYIAASGKIDLYEKYKGKLSDLCSGTSLSPLTSYVKAKTLLNVMEEKKPPITDAYLLAKKSALGAVVNASKNEFKWEEYGNCVDTNSWQDIKPTPHFPPF